MSTTATYTTTSNRRVYVGPGYAISTTEGLRSKPSGVKRRQKRGRVHFDPSLNWSIEEEKSFRGSAARRERQHQKKMARDVATERRKSVLRILKDPNKYDQIKKLYNAEAEPGQLYLIIHLHVIIGYQNGDTDFQQKFVQLQNSNLTYETLSGDQEEAVKGLSINALFVKEFEGVLPAEPVTDGSSSDDSRTQRKHKRQKNWQSTTEVVNKGNNLNNGGPPPPAGPNVVA